MYLFQSGWFGKVDSQVIFVKIALIMMPTPLLNLNLNGHR